MFCFDRKEEIGKALLVRGEEQERLFQEARRVRDEVFHGRVEVRSVMEYANVCRQACRYCGMSRDSGVKRFVLDDDEALEWIKRIYDKGRRVFMIQTGEFNSESYFAKVYALLKQVRERSKDLTVICSLGSLSLEKYKKLKDIGVERYLLKFETSDPRLYRQIKPTDCLKDRLSHIEMLKKLGFQVSSGNITGLPGQTLESLVDDLLLLKKLDIPMGSTSVFIPNDMSDYACCSIGDVDTALNFMAILRIMCPEMLIPATSSLELLKKDGQYWGLMAGANAVTIHDSTPREDEDKFVIYKKDRYKPKDLLLQIVEKAGLKPSAISLIRGKREDSLFYRFVCTNMNRTFSFVTPTGPAARCPQPSSLRLRAAGDAPSRVTRSGVTNTKVNQIAIYVDGNSYSYSDICDLTSKFCSFLIKRDIHEGDVVLLAMLDSIELVVALLSCIRLGIVAGLVDPRLSKDEWRDILSFISPKNILSTGSVSNTLEDNRILKVMDDVLPTYFLDLIAKEPESLMVITPDLNNPAIILFTSGSTGRPKGVVHSYWDLGVDTYPKGILKMSKKDVVFSYSRIHTSYGFGNNFLFPFHYGAKVILSRTIPNPFSLQEVLKLKPTLFFAVPSMYESLLAYGDSLGGLFKTVRLFIASGEKLYEDVAERWESIYHKRLLECFGSTEMGHPFISNISAKEKMNSCGKVLKGFKVKFNKKGRIFYRGPSLFSGYWNDSELTCKKLQNGWFKSDDIGYMDEKGYVFIQGRENMVFKLNGQWCSILDVEGKLRQCRIVKEVAVVGGRRGLDPSTQTPPMGGVFAQDSARRVVEDGTKGSPAGLHYFVSLRENMSNVQAERVIREYCVKTLPLFEHPRNIRILESLPRTRSGKINLGLLKI